jgi:hypothetical protein
LQLLQHPAPMLDLARGEDARERRGNQPHAFGAIDPRAVTLETEKATQPAVADDAADVARFNRRGRGIR